MTLKCKIDKNQCLTFLFSFISVLFAYSGMVKSLAAKIIPIDLTLLSFAILFLIFIIMSFNEGIPVIRPFEDSLIFLVLIITFMIFSAFYTLSESYYIKKILFFIFLNFGSFILGYYFIVKNIISFKFIQIVISLSALLIALIFLFLRITNQMMLYFYGEFSKLYPDYLVIGSYLALGMIINFNKNSIFDWIYRMILLAAIIILGGRGPLIFVFFIIILYGLKQWRPKQFLIFFLIIIVFTIIIFNTSIGDRLVIRLQHLTVTDNSVGTRIMLFNKALEIITINPVFGVGIGGFGKYVTHNDGRLYPHNIILEVAAENGIFAGIIWILLFFYLFFYLYLIYQMKPDNFVVYLICLFLLFNALKSSELLDLRTMFFWLGLYIGLFKNTPINPKFIYLFKSKSSISS